MFTAPLPTAIAAAQTNLAAPQHLATFHRLRAKTEPITVHQLRAQFRVLVDKVSGEAGLYAPEHAAIALKQAEGDVHEAVVILRAFRQTLSRRHTSEIIDTRRMWVQ